jgi:hypothetical protein
MALSTTCKYLLSMLSWISYPKYLLFEKLAKPPTLKQIKSLLILYIYYVGNLEPWTNFKAEAANAFQAQSWSPQVIDTRIIGPDAADSTDIEHVYVSCKTNVQGGLFG